MAAANTTPRSQYEEIEMVEMGEVGVRRDTSRRPSALPLDNAPGILSRGARSPPSGQLLPPPGRVADDERLCWPWPRGDIFLLLMTILLWAIFVAMVIVLVLIATGKLPNNI